MLFFQAYLNILKPFSLWVWIFIAVSLLSITLALLLVVAAENKLQKNTNEFLVYNALLIPFAMFVGQGNVSKLNIRPTFLLPKL